LDDVNGEGPPEKEKWQEYPQHTGPVDEKTANPILKMSFKTLYTQTGRTE
jgi:hypothetical protein